MAAPRKPPRKRGINYALLRRVRDHILEEPRRLYMGMYIRRKADGDVLSTNPWDHGTGKTLPYAPCGTAACIAGWAALLSGLDPKYGWLRAATVAAKALRLGEYSEQFDSLVAVDRWPEPFQSRYMRAMTAPARAKAAADRIDHFIATKGAE